MPDLISTIRKYSLSGTEAEVAAALNAKTERHEDHDRKTIADLYRIFGRNVVRGWVATIKTSPFACDLDVLIAGADFASDETIGIISEMHAAGLLNADQYAQALAIGVQLLSVWEKEGGTSPVSEAEVSEALTAIDRQNSIAAMQRRLDAAHAAATAVVCDGGTWDQVLATIQAG